MKSVITLLILIFLYSCGVEYQKEVYSSGDEDGVEEEDLTQSEEEKNLIYVVNQSDEIELDVLEEKEKARTEEKVLDNLEQFNRFNLNSYEVKRIEAYIYEALSGDGFGDLLSFYKSYKKPKIRAFLLGNQVYQGIMGLNYSGNDVDLMSQFLEVILEVEGDRVTVKKNLKRKEFNESFKEFTSEIKEDELIFIYYSGYAKENGVPVFVDQRFHGRKSFDRLLNSFGNDTILVMDMAYARNQDEKTVIVEEDQEDLRKNVVRIYSNLVEKKQKEGNYRSFEYRKLLRKTYALLKELEYERSGNGIFTLVFLSYFADLNLDDFLSEVSIGLLYSYIESKISLFEESGIVIRRPKKLPLLGSNFEKDQNNYILYQENLGELSERLSEEDSLLKSLYKKAVGLQRAGEFDLAANLFLSLNQKTRGEGYLNSNQLLSESFLKVGDNEELTPEKSINLYKKALRYNPSLDLEMVLSNIGSEIEKECRIMRRGLDRDYKDKEIDLKKGATLLYEEAKVKAEEGYAKYQNKDLKQALCEYSDSLRIFKRLYQSFKIKKNGVGLSILLNNIGVIYSVLYEKEKSLKYYNHSIIIKNQFKDYEGLRNTYNNHGILEYKRKNYDKALENFENSKEYFSLFSEGNNEKRWKQLSELYSNIARTYLKIGDKEKALEYQKEALSLLKKAN